MISKEHNISIERIKEVLNNLPDDAIVSDGRDLIDPSSIDLSNADAIEISTPDKAITIKKDGECFIIEEDTFDPETEDDQYDYSPYADGDKDPSKSFCDITPEGTKLEELLNITIGDILYIKKDDAITRFNGKDEDGAVFMQRIPSAIFEALDITRAVYNEEGRLTDADIMMLLKENLTADDKEAILTILSNAVTDTLEMPGDYDTDSYIWKTPHYLIKAHFIIIKKRELAALSFHRE